MKYYQFTEPDKTLSYIKLDEEKDTSEQIFNCERYLGIVILPKDAIQTWETFNRLMDLPEITEELYAEQRAALLLKMGLSDMVTN
jgi:hypothetical protein